MNSFYSAYIRIYVPSDIIPLALSLETPVHIQFDTVSSTKVSRVRAEVENYQGNFSSLSLLLAVQAHFDRYREIGEWLWLSSDIAHGGNLAFSSLPHPCRTERGWAFYGSHCT
jgi:hypothetical protein